MAEFGQPIRSATQDANEGVINPPTKRTVSSQMHVDTNKQKTSELDLMQTSVGSTLAEALAKRSKDERANIKEHKVNAAFIRQGQQKAINQVDADSKRTGWSEAIFGQDVAYRAAQQRAATNNVRAQYIEQAARIDEFAGETPDEYSDRLQAGLDSVLEPYADDGETKALITTNWMAASTKLAESQYKAHYAYNQNQQRETYEKQTQLLFDTLTVDKTHATSVGEAEEQLGMVFDFFNGADKPVGMSDTAWRGSVNNQLDVALRNGNIGAYHMAEMSGWVKDLSPQEKVKMDQALSAYDTDFSQQVQRTYEEANLSATEAHNLDEAVAIWEGLRNQLGSAATRSSRTPAAMSAITRSTYNTRMGESESSGRYDAVNRLGYAGKYQFGGLALQDTGYKDAEGKWTGKNGVNSLDDWKNDKEAQEEAMSELTANNRRRLDKGGAFTLVGKEFQGVIVTKQGLLAASHLVGAAGVLSMLQSGDVPEDANGTTALKYMSMFQDPETDVNQEVYEGISLDKYASGTERSKLSLAQQRTRAAKAVESINKLSRATATKAAKSAIKAETEKKRSDALKEAQRNPDAVGRSATLSELQPTVKEEENAMDASLVEDVQNMLGLDALPSMGEAAKAIMSDVNLARHAAKRIRGRQVDSPMLKRSIESVIGSFHTMTNEDGQINETGIKALESIAQFEKNEAEFKDMVGTSVYDNYEIVKRGMYLGQTTDMIAKDVDAFNKNKGNRAVYSANWELGEKESKRDRIQSLVNKWTEQTPQGASLAQYMEDYDRALVLYQGDRRSAEEYLYKSVQNAGITYSGKAILGGKRLNKVTEYSFETLMNSAQEATGNDASLLTGKLAYMGIKLEDEDGVTLRNLNQVPNVEFYTIDGVAGVYMTATGAQNDAFISDDDLKHWAKVTKQKQNFKSMRDKKDKEALERWEAELEAMQQGAPLSAGF